MERFERSQLEQTTNRISAFGHPPVARRAMPLSSLYRADAPEPAGGLRDLHASLDGPPRLPFMPKTTHTCFHKEIVKGERIHII